MIPKSLPSDLIGGWELVCAVRPFGSDQIMLKQGVEMIQPEQIAL